MSASVSDPATIRCRPHPAHWFFVVLLLAMATISIWGQPETATEPIPPALIYGAAVAFGLPAVLLTLFLLTGSIVAGAAGIRWRFWGRWHSAPWSSVTDYYDAAPQGNQKLSRSSIETTAGTVTLLEGSWTNGEAFRAAVRERATSAKPLAWGIKGARPEDDWPKTFSYDARRLRRELWPLALSVTAFYVVYFWNMIPKFIRVIGEIGWALGLGMIACALVAPAFVPLFLVYAMAPYREGLHRLGHRITVDPGGIAFEDGQRRVTSSWPGVTALRIVREGGLSATAVFVVATSQGEITFVRSMTDASLLRAAVERFTGRTFTLEDSGDRLIPPTAEETMGIARVYTYRNRTARALLWFPTAMAPITLVLSSLRYTGHMDSPADPTDPTGFIIGALLSVFTAWAWWRYRTVSVRTDSLGITWSSSGKRVFIPWSDIRACEVRKADIASYTMIRGSKDRIYVWFRLTGYEALQCEVESRAPALAKDANRMTTPTR